MSDVTKRHFIIHKTFNASCYLNKLNCIYNKISHLLQYLQGVTAFVSLFKLTGVYFGDTHFCFS